jgi:transposase
MKFLKMYMLGVQERMHKNTEQLDGLVHLLVLNLLLIFSFVHGKQ